MDTTITVRDFGTWEGKTVQQFTIAESGGIEVSIMNWGATITRLLVPDRNGVMGDVVLGFNTLGGYITSGNYYFGGICGRYANRIAGAQFSINGHRYKLSQNNPAGCLHGGFQGFDKKFWEAEILPGDHAVRFRYRSPDGEEGFPGNLDTEVTYTVKDHALHIGYRAISDQPTPVNLTNHSYFNLSGGTEPDVLSHQLQIRSGRIVGVGEGYIPTGRLEPVSGTPLDYSKSRWVGPAEGGPATVDFSYVVDRDKISLSEAAVLSHPGSGRTLTVLTTHPAIHYYSGHLLGGDMPDTKGGFTYGPCAGLCLETQHFPDSPNHPEFPNTIVTPREAYTEETVFRFSWENNH